MRRSETHKWQQGSESKRAALAQLHTITAEKAPQWHRSPIRMFSLLPGGEARKKGGGGIVLYELVRVKVMVTEVVSL